MKKTALLAAALALTSQSGFASPFLYNYTDFGLYTGEQGGFPASVAGDSYSVGGLRAAHAQKYRRWAVELGGSYGRNSLDFPEGEQAFTELGVQFAAGQYFTISDSLELAGFLGADYNTIETLEFTSSDSYLFARARASYLLNEKFSFNADYESRSGSDIDGSVVTLTAQWDSLSKLSVAFQHQVDLDSEDSLSENLLRIAYQTAPDLKFYLEHRSSSHEPDATAIIELGARILIQNGKSAPLRRDPPTRGQRRSAEDALRRDLPPSIR